MFGRLLALGYESKNAFHWLPWATLISLLSLAVSAIALSFVLWDRRAKLILRPRKGNWCTIKPALSGGEIIFAGIVELYNASSRANVIQNYEFWCRTNDDWKQMDSEYYRQSPPMGALNEICNKTPLTIGPYAGCDLHVMAFIKMTQPYEMYVRVRVQDLFGNWYQTEVKAIS